MYLSESSSSENDDDFEAGDTGSGASLRHWVWRPVADFEASSWELNSLSPSDSQGSWDIGVDDDAQDLWDDDGASNGPQSTECVCVLATPSAQPYITSPRLE
jgi:hypothetical protein